MSSLFALIITHSAAAITFTAFDARTMSMGGAGVASASPYNAIQFNPALLLGNSAQNMSNKKRKRYFLRPALGARVIDRDNFIDSIQQYQKNDNREKLDNALLRYTESASLDSYTLDDVLHVLDNAGEVIQHADDLLEDYRGLSQKPLRVAGSYGINLGYSGDQHAFAAHLRHTLRGGALIHLSKRDLAALQSTLDEGDLVVNGLQAVFTGDVERLLEQINAGLFDVNGPQRIDSYSSTVEFTGATTIETALAYAGHIKNYNYGLTLKSIQFETLDYLAIIDEADSDAIDHPANRKTYTDLNADLGLIRHMTEKFKMGLMIKNIFTRDYITQRGNVIKLRPLVRVGFGYEHNRLNLAADLDLTENDPIGFDPQKRYLALGAEYRLWRNTALRAGMRHNMVIGSKLYSLGIGLGTYSTHMDIALAGHGDEIGLALQLGIHF